jgi:hypothetical protein
MSSASIQTLRRGLSEWAQHEGHQRFLRDDQQVLLEEFAGVPERRTQANVAAWMLGTWQLGNGMHRVLEGDAEGFDEARVGQSLRRAALLSRARHQRAPRRGPRPLSRPPSRRRSCCPDSAPYPSTTPARACTPRSPASCWPRGGRCR